MRPSDVKALTRRTSRIDGWFSSDAAALFALINATQHRMAAKGDLIEIGVHHGKSAVLLCAMAGSQETVRVCDIFSDQSSNASSSGSGDRAIFERNMAIYAPDRQVTIFQKLSSHLTEEEIGRSCRFFHIDGGHLAEEALADLQLGASSLIDRGAIVVDDPFRPEWPGVTEAIIQFLNERPDFAPLTLAFNKLVIVPRESHEDYEKLILARLWSYVSAAVYERKVIPIAGTPTHILFIPTKRQIASVHPLVARLKYLELKVRKSLRLFPATAPSAGRPGTEAG